jgi:FdhD protein
VSRSVIRVKATQAETIDDAVLEEVPVALVYNGISHAVMLASPCDLADFALGFSLSEGIVTRKEEIYDLEIAPSCNGISIHLEISTAQFAALKQRRRQLAGRTGCGLCGVDSLAALGHHQAAPLAQSPATPWLSLEALETALAALHRQQSLRQQTGAAHGAAWVSPSGAIILLREDVGRHNALDKLIGALAWQQINSEQGWVLVTSRASYEMVQKTASAGIPLLAAISAPTGLAVREAERLGMTLLGFARPGQVVIYSHPQRMIGHAPL